MAILPLNPADLDLNAAERAFAYLAEVDPLPERPADAIVGFGTFDLSLARYCGELQVRGHARRIFFSGGVGAGTADLGGPEADVWLAELRRSHPAIDWTQVVVENRSTNTAENISFLTALLARDHPTLAFGIGVRSVIAVASPSRLRRVAQTWRKLLPQVTMVRQRPMEATLSSEQALYASKGYDYRAHLSGELDRLIDYAARGWISSDPLPEGVAAAHARLRG